MYHRPDRELRAPIDPEARRYYVYCLRDDTGATLYVGRSCQPLTRLRQHRSEHGWAAEVVEIDAWGPYAWGDAVRLEREAVYKMGPKHNRMYVTSHTWRAS